MDGNRGMHGICDTGGKVCSKLRRKLLMNIIVEHPQSSRRPEEVQGEKFVAQYPATLLIQSAD